MEDFFVEPTECMFCGAPPEAAPNLMGMRINDAGHEECYFKRQPTNRAEVDEAIAGIRASCCGAVRYSGNDQYVLGKTSQAHVVPLIPPLGEVVHVGRASNHPIISTPAMGFIARLLKRFR